MKASPIKNPNMDFTERCRAHWTKERLRKLMGDHKYHVLPTNAPVLLRTLGLLNSDGSMSADSTKKFIQINHLLALFRPAFEDLNQRHKKVRILDAGCGSAFLTFILAWAYKELWHHDALVVGVDSNANLIGKNKISADSAGFSSTTKFARSSIEDLDWSHVLAQLDETVHEDPKKSRPHAVIALHACDTATDDTIALGIKLQADFIAVAPCCQAELARHWKKLGDELSIHPLKPAFKNPHLRRELAAHFTDLARVLILRGHGYEVTTTEFTMSHATPKNTLILATRRGSFLKDAQQEYAKLSEMIGGCDISLATKAPFQAAT
jgi:SAM-dependent methyltransferase